MLNGIFSLDFGLSLVVLIILRNFVIWIALAEFRQVSSHLKYNLKLFIYRLVLCFPWEILTKNFAFA